MDDFIARVIILPGLALLILFLAGDSFDFSYLQGCNGDLVCEMKETSTGLLDELSGRIEELKDELK